MKKLETHNFGVTYQEGIVNQVDPKTHRIKCAIPALEDFETAWLAYLVPNAGGNQFYCLPDAGELVAVLLDARGEGGCVLGAIYNESNPVPVADSEIWLHKFSNGTEISHNRKTDDVIVKTSGNVQVTASAVEINAPTTINGDTKINGSLTTSGAISSDTSVSAPSVKQGLVELGSHKHNESFNARLRDLHRGVHHKCDNKYALHYANQAAFMSDNRRKSNDDLFHDILKRCLWVLPLREWVGYWQGNHRHGELISMQAFNPEEISQSYFKIP